MINYYLAEVLPTPHYRLQPEVTDDIQPMLLAEGKHFQWQKLQQVKMTNGVVQASATSLKVCGACQGWVSLLCGLLCPYD